MLHKVPNWEVYLFSGQLIEWRIDQGKACAYGQSFCFQHRTADTHNCTFDYKTAAREQLRKDNPTVKGEKVRKI